MTTPRPRDPDTSTDLPLGLRTVPDAVDQVRALPAQDLEQLLADLVVKPAHQRWVTVRREPRSGAA